MTDYTQKNTLDFTVSQQYRALKEVRDILYNWFSDQKNIKDTRLWPYLYDADGKFNKCAVRIDTPFNPDKQYIGATPSIVISLGNISYQKQNINYGGNRFFITDKTQPVIARTHTKTFSIEVYVFTQSYDATVLLSQIIELFLTSNCDAIHKSCGMFDSFFVSGVSAPQQVKPAQQLNAKQLYMSTIKISITGHVTWLQDTQGPVFNGIQYTIHNKD